MIQLFVKTIDVDLIYISFILVTFMLYNVIYRKDMVFNLKPSGHGEILTNNTEIVLADEEKDC